MSPDTMTQHAGLGPRALRIAPKPLRDHRDRFRGDATDVGGSCSDDISRALSRGDFSVDATDPPAIARLPRELLILIFRFCVDLEDKYVRGPRTYPLRYNWRKLMFVCPAWWRIVQNTSELWTSIASALRSEKECKVALACSGDSRLLSVDARFRNKQGPLMESRHVKNLRFVLENAPLARIEELAIAVGVDDDGFAPIYKTLCTAATTLKSFSLTSCDPPMPAWFPHRSLSLPIDILAGTAPCLERLALRNVRLDWRSSLIRAHPNLQYLTLSDVTLPFDVHVFWDALSCLPDLISLVLGPFISSISQSLHRPRRPIIFARMARLVLHARDYICAWLWSDIIISPTGNIKMFTLVKTVHRLTSPEEMCEEVLRHIVRNSEGHMKIRALFELSVVPSVGPLSKATKLHDIVRISAWCEMGQRVDLAYLFPDINLDADEQCTLRTEIMARVIVTLGPSATEEMRINDQPRYPVRDSERAHLLRSWRRVDLFNKLKTLHIVGQAAYGFVEALYQHGLEHRHKDRTGTVSPNSVILPYLEVLRFEGIDITREVDDPCGRRKRHQACTCEARACPVRQHRTFRQALLQALRGQQCTAPNLKEVWFSDCRSMPRREGRRQRIAAKLKGLLLSDGRNTPQRDESENLYDIGIPQVKEESPGTFQWNLEESMVDTSLWELTDPDFDMYIKY